MKDKLKTLWVWTVSIYLFVGSFAFIYYNYEYARTHSFASWLFLGQVVPTLKAAAWPLGMAGSIYERVSVSSEESRLSSLREWTIRARRENSIAPKQLAALQFMEMINEIRVSSKLLTGFSDKPDAIQRIAMSMKGACESMSGIDPSLLIDVHKDLPVEILKYQQACVMLTRAVNANDSALCLQAIAAANQMPIWIKAHFAEVDPKITSLLEPALKQYRVQK